MDKILLQLSILLIPIFTLWFGLTRFKTGAAWFLATLAVGL